MLQLKQERNRNVVRVGAAQSPIPPHPQLGTDRASPHRGCFLTLHTAQGGAAVEVEQRGSGTDGFGRGPDTHVPLPFGAVVRRCAAGDASLYLTTQVSVAEAIRKGARGTRCSLLC